MPDDYPVIKGEVIWPTKEQRDKGLEEIERFAPHWSASQALLIIKPRLGLIVSLKRIDHDERHFGLTVTVEEIMVAPPEFDPQKPLMLRCVWNQPYLSLSAKRISAPYSFYLHFGAEGVRQVREFSITKKFNLIKQTEKHAETILGLLSHCFSMKPDQLERLLKDDIG